MNWTAARRTLAVALLALAACSGRAGQGPSNSLLIVGYDREPDTLNRFASHILEDIETCVVEGLVTTDEKMRIVPLLVDEGVVRENFLHIRVYLLNMRETDRGEKMPIGLAGQKKQ